MTDIRIKKHIGYYISLISFLILGIAISIQASYDRQLQMYAVVLTAMFYVGWGMLHHYLHHDLNVKIVVEYVLIASLGAVLVLFLMQGRF